MIITHGSDPSQVALTFDDGPNMCDTSMLLHILAKHKAKATFFMLGKWVKEQPDIARQVYDDGHEIGNHTMNHAAADSVSREQLAKEINECQFAITNATGGMLPVLVRPPFGRFPCVVDEIGSVLWNMNTVLWSQSCGDWVSPPVEEIVNSINLDTEKGEIVLMHDGAPDKLGADRSHTVEAVEIILQKYSHKKFVTVSELTLG